MATHLLPDGTEDKTTERSPLNCTAERKEHSGNNRLVYLLLDSNI